MIDSKDCSKTVRTVDQNGTIRYYDVLGQFHNEYGPSVIYLDGSIAFYYHGKLHCDDGPAVIYSDGSEHYYLDNNRYTEDEFRLLQFFRL